jgi:hypothetical protein
MEASVAAAARLIPADRLLSGVLAHGGSGYEQTEAELCRVEGDKIAVALGPLA